MANNYGYPTGSGVSELISGNINKFLNALGLGTTGEMTPKVPRTRDPYKTYNPIAEAFPSVSPGLPDEYETNLDQVNVMDELNIPPVGQKRYRVNRLQRLQNIDMPMSPEIGRSLFNINAYSPAGKNIDATDEDISYGYTADQAAAIIQMLQDALKDPALSPEDRKVILEVIGAPTSSGNIEGAQGSGMSETIGSTKDFMRGN
tara:strand:+ start:3612 stop:4220 length:609 start_codon:yes stop_codon:yes gene_type:complete